MIKFALTGIPSSIWQGNFLYVMPYVAHRKQTRDFVQPFGVHATRFRFLTGQDFDVPHLIRMRWCPNPKCRDSENTEKFADR